jgi:ligand-binding SRPBCC domain-containing protein
LLFIITDERPDPLSQLWNSYEQQTIREFNRSRETHETPLRFYAELFVAHSPAAVWSFFSDVAMWKSWSPICRGCWLADQAELQAGSVIEIRFRILGVTLSVPTTVVQCNPPHSITWQGQKFGIQATHSYRFIPRNGGTLLCNEETFSGVSFPLRRLMSAWYRASKLSSASLLGIERKLASD